MSDWKDVAMIYIQPDPRSNEGEASREAFMYDQVNDPYYYMAKENANQVQDFDTVLSREVSDQRVKNQEVAQTEAKAASKKKLLVGAGVAAGLWFMLK